MACHTRSTAYWREPWKGATLCNACALRYKKRGKACSKCLFVPYKDCSDPSTVCPRCQGFPFTAQDEASVPIIVRIVDEIIQSGNGVIDVPKILHGVTNGEYSVDGLPIRVRGSTGSPASIPEGNEAEAESLAHADVDGEVDPDDELDESYENEGSGFVADECDEEHFQPISEGKDLELTPVTSQTMSQNISPLIYTPATISTTSSLSTVSGTSLGVDGRANSHINSHPLPAASGKVGFHDAEKQDLLRPMLSVHSGDVTPQSPATSFHLVTPLGPGGSGATNQTTTDLNGNGLYSDSDSRHSSPVPPAIIRVPHTTNAGTEGNKKGQFGYLRPSN